MPTRFYYAPIDPNYEAISGGIDRGVNNFLDERDRRRDRKRQSEVDALEQELHEIGLHESGYRRGQAPVEETDLASRPRPQRPELPELFGRPDQAVNLETGELYDPRQAPNELNDVLARQVRSDSARIREQTSGIPRVGSVGMSLFERGTPEIPGAELEPERTTVTRPRAGYEQVTEDLYRVPPSEQAAAVADQEPDYIDEISEALLGIYPDMTPEEARGHAVVMERGGSSIYSDVLDLFPDEDLEDDDDLEGVIQTLMEQDPDMTEDEARRRAQALDQGVGVYDRLFPEEDAPAGGSTARPMTFAQAMDYLDEAYLMTDRWGEPQGSYLSNAEKYQLAIEMSRQGAGAVELPDVDELHQRYMESQNQGAAPDDTDEPGFFSRLLGGGRRRSNAGGAYPTDAEPQSDTMERFNRGSGGVATPPSRTTPTDPGDVRIDEQAVQVGRELIDEFPGLARDEYEEILEAEGWNDREIEAILEGR